MLKQTRLWTSGFLAIYATIAPFSATGSGYTNHLQFLITVFFIPMLAIILAAIWSETRLRGAYDKGLSKRKVITRRGALIIVLLIAVMHTYFLMNNFAESLQSNIPAAFHGPADPTGYCPTINGWIELTPFTTLKPLQYNPPQCYFWRVDIASLSLGIAALLIVAIS